MTNQHTSTTNGSVPPGRRPRKRRPDTRRTVLVLAAGSAAALRAAGRLRRDRRDRRHGPGTPGRPGPVDHPLQRPARADHQRPGHRVREADRDQGQRPLRRRGHPGQPDRRARGRTPRPTCSSPRTRPRSSSSRRRACCRTVTPGHARRYPGQVQLARRRLGRGVRPGQRDRLQPDADQPDRSSPPVVMRARRPEVEGQARHRAGRDRLPADRHLGHQDATARPPRVSVAGEGQVQRAPATSTPTTRRSSAT